MVRAVAAGKADLGWAGARVFDTMGVTSFQALQAPMLIDSYALEQAVVASDIPGQMLQGLDKVGVARPRGPRRQPAQADRRQAPPARPRGLAWDHLRHLQVAGQAQAIRSLGATPMEVFRRSRNQALLDGKLAGVRDEPARLRAQRPGECAPRT